MMNHHLLGRLGLLQVVPLVSRKIATSCVGAKNREPVKSTPNKNPQEVADLRKGLGVPFEELPIVHVKATYNNTLVYLTDHNGLTATWTSAGIEGFRNARRGTNYAGQKAGHSLAEETYVDVEDGASAAGEEGADSGNAIAINRNRRLNRAANLGVNRVRVKVKGMGPGRQSCVKGLVSGGLDIVSITDVTPIPHNGPRPPKQRRL